LRDVDTPKAKQRKYELLLKEAVCVCEKKRKIKLAISDKIWIQEKTPEIRKWYNSINVWYNFW